MTPAELAYMAGVLDAVGRIRVRQTGASSLAVVAISSPNIPLLERIARSTGVRVVEVRRIYTRLGCSEHCDQPHLHVRSLTGRWELVGARAVVVLRSLQPYLVDLAEDAESVLAATGDAPSKPATLRKMAQLGWAS
jgi:hypothetical protein